MEEAIYGALDAVDRYQATVQRLLDAQEAADEPNVRLVKRYKEFLRRSASMITTLEDDVVNDLLYCRHRLFAVDLSEKGEFI